MKKITPNLWFDKEAKEAAEFYTTLFPSSRVTNVTTLHDTPSGDADVVSFVLAGQDFMAISAGPHFKLNPSISFMVNFDPSEDIDALDHLNTAWEKLSLGGLVRMPIDTYPFSERYGWVDDKYGLSWQLILTKLEGEKRPTIIPSLLFVGDVYGKAEEASDYYISVFSARGDKDSRRGITARYPAGMEPDREGAIMFTDFALNGQWFSAMDSAHKHDFAFNEALSFAITCDSQEEIDFFWERLSAVSASEQCGWCKDKYGVSWQIVPSVMNKMMMSGDSEKVARVVQALMPMKKIDVAKLEAAYNA